MEDNEEYQRCKSQSLNSHVHSETVDDEGGTVRVVDSFSFCNHGNYSDQELAGIGRDLLREACGISDESLLNLNEELTVRIVKHSESVRSTMNSIHMVVGATFLILSLTVGIAICWQMLPTIIITTSSPQADETINNNPVEDLVLEIEWACLSTILTILFFIAFITCERFISNLLKQRKTSVVSKKNATILEAIMATTNFLATLSIVFVFYLVLFSISVFQEGDEEMNNTPSYFRIIGSATYFALLIISTFLAYTSLSASLCNLQQFWEFSMRGSTVKALISSIERTILVLHAVTLFFLSYLMLDFIATISCGSLKNLMRSSTDLIMAETTALSSLLTVMFFAVYFAIKSFKGNHEKPRKIATAWVIITKNFVQQRICRNAVTIARDISNENSGFKSEEIIVQSRVKCDGNRRIRAFKVTTEEIPCFYICRGNKPADTNHVSIPMDQNQNLDLTHQTPEEKPLTPKGENLEVVA